MVAIGSNSFGRIFSYTLQQFKRQLIVFYICCQPLPAEEEKELKQTLQDILGQGKTVKVEQKVFSLLHNAICFVICMTELLNKLAKRMLVQGLLNPFYSCSEKLAAKTLCLSLTDCLLTPCAGKVPNSVLFSLSFLRFIGPSFTL